MCINAIDNRNIKQIVLHVANKKNPMKMNIAMPNVAFK